ncbi:MAG: hypothetical protein ACR2GP_07055 [Burkholderiaceae bacterium]
MASAMKIHPLLWELPVLALFFVTVAVVTSITIFPQVPLAIALIYAAAGAVAFLALISIGIIVASRINAYVLSQGGTDTHWLWFKSEARGLVRLREEAGTKSDDTLQEPEPNLRGRGL